MSRVITSGPRSLDRNLGIDLLRAVAILPVIAVHWRDSGLALPSTSAASDAFARIAGHGHYGVALFFIISGFLITRTTMAREPDLFSLSARDFYVRRIGRIQPLYVAVVVLGALILLAGDPASRIFRYCFRDHGSEFGADFWLSLFTFTFNWLRILRDHFWGFHWDVMWSLAVEEQFYLAFPLLLIWARTRRRLLWVLCAVIALGVAVRILVDAFALSFVAKTVNSFVCFDTLALGVLLALFGEQLPHSRAAARAAVALGALAVAWAYYHGGVVFLIVGGSLFLHGARYARLFRHGSWMLAARFGQLSYGLYLLHATAIFVTSPITSGMGALGGYVLVALSTLVMAELVYRLYEVPMNAWIRARWIDGPGDVLVKV